MFLTFFFFTFYFIADNEKKRITLHGVHGQQKKSNPDKNKEKQKKEEHSEEEKNIYKNWINLQISSFLCL